MVNAMYAVSAQFERDVCAIAWEMGAACIRGAASGGSRRRWMQPDVVIITRDACYAVECRVTHADFYMTSLLWLPALREWRKRVNCYAVIIVKFIGRGYDYIIFDALLDEDKIVELRPRFKTLRETIKHIIIS